MYQAHLSVLMMTLVLVEVRCARQESLILQTKPGQLPTQVYLKLPMLIQADTGALSHIDTNSDSTAHLHVTNLLIEDLTTLYSKTPRFQNIEDITFIIERKRQVTNGPLLFDRQRHINMNFTLVCSAGESLSNITDVVKAVITPGLTVAEGQVNINETKQALANRLQEFPKEFSCVQSDVFSLRCPEKNFRCQNTSDRTWVKCKQMCSVLLNPCQNSGKCHVAGSQMVCNCRDGTVFLYSGEHCEHAHMKLPFTITINIGMIVVIVLTIVISIIVYRKRKQAKLAKKKESERTNGIKMHGLRNGVYHEADSTLTAVRTSWRNAFDNNTVELQQEGSREANVTNIRVIKNKQGAETYIYQPKGSGDSMHHDDVSMTETVEYRVPRARLSSNRDSASRAEINITRPGSSNDFAYDNATSTTNRCDSISTTSMTSPFDNVEKFQISRPHIKTTSTQL